MPIRVPSNLKTPPYVTAKPVVTHRKLDLNSKPDGSIQFLVLATDGLWDELSSEQVVSLVGGYFAGLKGKISRSDLETKIPITVDKAGVEGKLKSHGRDGDSWIFKDDNPSTHLIRNALGGGDENTFRTLVSIPSPYSRRYRDDITVTVVWWEKGKEQDANVSTLTSASGQEQVKAKL
jgi:pyruvate dehydrogenase phosphatase